MFGGRVVPAADNGRMIILRTFCPFDIDKLADGFDAWVTFFPCGNPDAPDDLMEVRGSPTCAFQRIDINQKQEEESALSCSHPMCSK